jgi:tetratricopeptide (TPR) repeat protein
MLAQNSVIILKILIIFIFLSACRYHSKPENDLVYSTRDKIRTHYAELVSDRLKKEEMIDSLMEIAKDDPVFISNYIDSTMAVDSSFSLLEILKINTLLGEFFIEKEQYLYALNRFERNDFSKIKSPRNYKGRVKCYLHLKDSSKALEMLEKAALINPLDSIYIGHFYEMTNDLEKALKIYTIFYNNDTASRQKVKLRINQLTDDQSNRFKNINW